MLFNFIFRTFQKHAFCQILFGGRSYYMLIVKFWMLRKLLNNRSSRPEVFCKKVLLKTSKKWQENTCARVYFLVKFQVRDCNFIKKRHQHRCFPVKYAKFILQNTSGGINKKSKVHKQRVLLKIIYYYTTGWLLNKAFNVSLWNKTKNSSCSRNAENTVIVTLEPKIVDYEFFFFVCCNCPNACLKLEVN